MEWKRLRTPWCLELGRASRYIHRYPVWYYSILAFYVVMIDRHSSLPLLSEWLFFLISDFWTRLSIENMVRRASRKGLSLSDSKIHRV